MMNEMKNGDLLYGYAEIGAYLGLTGKQVEHLSTDAGADIPVFNIGRRRCALKSRLDAWLTAQADRQALDRLADDGGRAE